MARQEPLPLMRKVDCIRLYVPDLDAGLAFYVQQLGHQLIWRTAQAAGLCLPETDAELVLQTEDPGMEVDFTVDSAEAAVARFKAAGGQIVVPPFDIHIGRCAVVQDPWGNRLVLLDMSKGRLVTDGEGYVLGTEVQHNWGSALQLRLVAVDLDGTLLTSEKVLAPDGTRRLAQAAQRGVRVVIATTRNPYFAREVCQELGVQDPIICTNGAQVWASPDGPVWAHHVIPQEVGLALAHLADEHNWELGTTVGQVTYLRQRPGQTLGPMLWSAMCCGF